VEPVPDDDPDDTSIHHTIPCSTCDVHHIYVLPASDVLSTTSAATHPSPIDTSLDPHDNEDADRALLDSGAFISCTAFLHLLHDYKPSLHPIKIPEVVDLTATAEFTAPKEVVTPEMWEHGVTPEDTEIHEGADDDEIAPGDVVVEEEADGDDELEPPSPIEEDEVEK